MDANYVNTFIDSFNHVMTQLGFSSIERGNLSVKGKVISAKGIILAVGLVGQLKGNVIYIMDKESAKKIASKMMMGMPVDELDDMAKSSLSELSNMLSANAATGFSKSGILIDISPPSLLEGDEVNVTMSSEKVLGITLMADGIPLEINISLAG